MSRIWFSQDVETVAVYWRVMRRDGVALGFATHDADLWFDGILHRAAPGMLPSAIRRSANLEADSAEIDGALSHDSISAEDLAAGRFDGARIIVGLVDWQSCEHEILFQGTIGTVSEESGKFSAALQSRKVELQSDPVPRTSPTCRADFCGPQCNLSVARFTHRATVTGANTAANAIQISGTLDRALLVGGQVRWLSGPGAGLRSAITGISGSYLILDLPMEWSGVGESLELREGCDRTIATCAGRFANAINFRGEPYLPGNDLLARYPSPA